MTVAAAIAARRRKVWTALLLWALCAGLAFWSFAQTEPTGDSFLRGINRVGVFLSWHLAALVPALAAFVLARSLPPSFLRKLTWLPVGLYGAACVGLLVVILWAQIAAAFERQDPVQAGTGSPLQPVATHTAANP